MHDYTVEHGAYPSPLHYHNFPRSVCTSVNEVVCHGIPDMRELQDGDIVNVDVSCMLNGYHGDLNETFVVGEVDAASKKLVKARPFHLVTCLTRSICHGLVGVHRSVHSSASCVSCVYMQLVMSTALLQVTYECLMKAIAAVKPGMRYRDVGDIISKHALKNGFSVITSYCGHGICDLFHCQPNVPHYARNKAKGVMEVRQSAACDSCLRRSP